MYMGKPFPGATQIHKGPLEVSWKVPQPILSPCVFILLSMSPVTLVTVILLISSFTQSCPALCDPMD